jgi:hypothetical protein
VPTWGLAGAAAAVAAGNAVAIVAAVTLLIGFARADGNRQ